MNFIQKRNDSSDGLRGCHAEAVHPSYKTRSDARFSPSGKKKDDPDTGIVPRALNVPLPTLTIDYEQTNAWKCALRDALVIGTPCWAEP
jgi:hypothetical protein